MTLDVGKYFVNLVKKEAKISHMAVDVKAGKTNRITADVRARIEAENGETYLRDANYVLFFTKQEGWDSDAKKGLFQLVNRALGNAANNSNESDFKVLKAKKPVAEDDVGEEDVVVEEPETTEVAEPAEEELDTTLFLKVTLK